MMMLMSMVSLLLSGVAGIPRSYTPRLDDGVSIILVCCFFLSSFVLSRNRKFLLQLIKDFLLHRQRTSIFSTSTASDMRSLLLLTLQTCMLCAILLFCIFLETTPELIVQHSSLLLLAIYFAICMLYVVLKWLAYSLIGWIFFDGEKVELWIESYSTLLYYLGFALFPFVLLEVYFAFDLPVLLSISLIFLLFVKILEFYKWLKLFCAHFYGVILLIMYFCALEVMPYVLLFYGILQLNECLIIKN